MRWLTLLILAVLTGCSATPEKTALVSPEIETRVAAWHELVQQGKGWPDSRRLEAANDFINQLVFVDDIQHWQQQDYWATPLQTIVSGGGDCEDFSIAKYFTLTGMGMDETRLRLTYVKALTLNQAHMVVSYYPEPKSTPLVLDNLNPRILPADQRDDLYPVYSFNGDGLWVTSKNYNEQRANDAERVGLWQSLRQKMAVEARDEKRMVCLYQFYDLPQSEAKARCQ